MSQFQGLDSTLVPYAFAPMYGHLYEDAASPVVLAQPVQGTFYGWVGATAGPLKGLTADVADGTADHLTVPSGGAGDYFIAFAVSGITGDAGINHEWSVFVNGSQQTEITVHTNRADTTMTGARGACGVLALSDADEVSLRCANNSGTENTGYQAIQLTMYRVGT